MSKSNLIVRRIIESVEDMNRSYPFLSSFNISTLAEDDMMFFMEKMIDMQEFYRSKGYNHYIDTGYHHTKPKNMTSIRTEGLMSNYERLGRKARKRLTFGDGIYTGNYPDSFTEYGSVGLIVARLQGNIFWVPTNCIIALPHVHRSLLEESNTIIGNKMTSHGKRPVEDEADECVLKCSSQCVPLIQYDVEVIRKQSGAKQVIRFIQELIQNILDEELNSGCIPQHRSERKPVESSLFVPHHIQSTLTLSGNRLWHRKSDFVHRREMFQQLNEIQSWKPVMLTNRFQSLRFVEEALYQSAPSLAKYKDSDTLEERLREKEFVLSLDSQQRGTKHDFTRSHVRNVPHRPYKLPERETKSISLVCTTNHLSAGEQLDMGPPARNRTF